MLNTVKMTVDKHIQKHQEKITKEAFQLYKKAFRGKGTPSLSQMNALISIVRDANSYESLIIKLKEFLTKQKEKNEEKKMSWAKDLGGVSLAKIVEEKVQESLEGHDQLKHYISDIKAEASFLKSGKGYAHAADIDKQVMDRAKLHYLKSFFAALLAFYRIEREKLTVHDEERDLVFSLPGGELQCR